MSEQSKKWQPFNLNYLVKVQLNEKGYQLLVDQHNQYCGVIKNWEKRDITYYKNKADVDGYLKFQAWEFIEKFIDAIGLCKPHFFSYDILIEIRQ